MSTDTCEETHLLPVVRSYTKKTKHSNCFTRSCCIRSKAARLILLWNFAVLLAYKMFYDINILCFQVGTTILLPAIPLTIIAVLSPVAGLLTDIRFSRVKVVICNSYVIIVELVILFIVLASLFSCFYRYGQIRQVGFIIAIVLFGILFIMVTVYVVFIINAIQFGMDQLHDSTTEDSILYNHTLVCVDLLHLLTNLSDKLEFPAL